MPYWRRPEALAQNLERYRSLYRYLDYEIVVVDDGSWDMLPIGGLPLWVNVLPRKDHALNPCTAFNDGAAIASGEFIVLTNPEVVHRAPILAEMRETLTQLGPKGYVAAACWSPEQEWWFCHSRLGPAPEKVGRAPMPEGAGLHFCSMLHRTLYDEIGGFTEDYRGGQGYEDNDFLWKLQAVGARFSIRDDLVTDHRPCPRSHWPAGGAARNRAIFEARWPNV